MKKKYTVIVEEQPDGNFTAYVEELPGANAQGAALDEALVNVAEAIRLVQDTNAELTQE